MRTIHVKYDDVYAETLKLRNRISSDVINRATVEYRQIQMLLDSVDGTSNARLKETMEHNLRKTVMVAETFDKLLQFISKSAKQIEISEQQMARSFASSTRASGGIIQSQLNQGKESQNGTTQSEVDIHHLNRK